MNYRNEDTRLTRGLAAHRNPVWLGLFVSLAALAACSTQGTTVNPIAVGTAGAGTTGASAGTAAVGGAAVKSAAGAGGQISTTVGAAGVVAVAGTGAAGATGNAGKSGATGAAGAAGAADSDDAGLPDTSEPGGAGGTIAAGTGGTSGAGGASAASACVQALTPKCQTHDTSACSSFMTIDVGTLVKATELQLGPYGATMEYNVGKGFEVPKNASEDSCALVASSFGEPADVTARLVDLKDVDLTLYTVYRPACMKDGETYPVITWGNGTCGQTEGYGALLRYIASYGYVVFASNSRYTSGNGAMTKALDFAAAANKDSSSVYYNRLDLTKIGAMGHSQGGAATVTAAMDARVKSVIIWNAATSAMKPFLAVSGDTDITGFTPTSMANDIAGAVQPAAWLYYHKVPKTGSVSGHLTLMIQPERVVEPARAWWDYQLKGDTTARDFFVGASCGLCSDKADYEYGEHGLK